MLRYIFLIKNHPNDIWWISKKIFFLSFLNFRIPFTIQRLCELLTEPKRNYTGTDKFLRGVEKVSPQQCGCCPYIVNLLTPAFTHLGIFVSF